MEITFDPAKDAANVAKHGIPLGAAVGFEWETAVIAEDSRRVYGETRYEAVGLLNGRVHVLVFVVRDAAVRVISFRKANRREVKKYGN